MNRKQQLPESTIKISSHSARDKGQKGAKNPNSWLFLIS